MPRFLVSWSERAWYEQEVEAADEEEAGERWDPVKLKHCYQSEITDDWFAIEALDDEEAK